MNPVMQLWHELNYLRKRYEEQLIVAVIVVVFPIAAFIGIRTAVNNANRDYNSQMGFHRPVTTHQVSR